MSALKELVSPPVEQIELWPIERVLANPLNPRGELMPDSLDELAASIVEHGILTPLLAVPAGDFVHIVAGHRRRAAAEMSGLRELPVILHRLTPVEQLEVMLVENLQRRDLSPLQEARGFQALTREGLSQREIARRLSVQPNRVSLGLDLLKLDPTVARSFDRGDLPSLLIKEFARVRDFREQRRYATLALQRRLKATELAECMRQQRSAEAHITVAVRPRAEAEGAAEEHPPTGDGAPGRAENVSGHEPAGRAARPGAHTRSEAAALLSGNDTASFAVLRRALGQACRGCDEERFPAICRACPIPQFIATLVAEVRRAQR
ncbi:MAG TPA: ParB/RepB/Spo0J family partition protein [Pyrinomonadaceae bacterium]|nr:ParB/RepB/Spo0J family partition protein [Pyrinomonadaceae bacterium]